jgi:hypothetical protein
MLPTNSTFHPGCACAFLIRVERVMQRSRREDSLFILNLQKVTVENDLNKTKV